MYVFGFFWMDFWIWLFQDECPPVPKDELIRNHLERWTKVKQKWISQANKNEERFESSFQILTTIYNKCVYLVDEI